MRRTLTALLAAGTLLLAGCSDVGSTGDKGYISGDGVLDQIAPGDRERPIDLAGDDLEGNPLDVGDLRGEVVVINVWGSWCPPCRAEQPDLNEIAADLGDTATFVGLNVRDNSPATAQAYVRRFEVPYPSLYSPDGRELLAFAGILTPRSIPSTLVLDREGRVAVTVLGPVAAPSTLKAMISDVAAEDG